MEVRHTDPCPEPTPVRFVGHRDADVLDTVRLTALTDPTSSGDAIEVNEDTLVQSLAHPGRAGTRRPVRRSNETMPPFDVEPLPREGRFCYSTPWCRSGSRCTRRVGRPGRGGADFGLSERYLEFKEAYAQGKVSHHILLARSDDLPKEDTFELVAAGAERCRSLGYEYVVTEATNQWTGAAFEALGGVRVHFRPFKVESAVPKSDEPLEDVTTSPNGFLSDKDSRGMFLRDPSRLEKE